MKSYIFPIIIKHILQPIVDGLFPPVCYICNRYLPPGKEIICESCWSDIPLFKNPIAHSFRKRCFDNLYILFEFQETIQHLIHLLKYKRHITLASYFATEAISKFDFKTKSDYTEIIPVPLFISRKRERGYNQSEEIAKVLAINLNIPVKAEHLLRIRSTSTQTKMTREERELNVKGAFYCPNKLIEHKILLIDDVITTGSTIEACVKTLKMAGANKVDVFVIAHPLEKV